MVKRVRVRGRGTSKKGILLWSKRYGKEGQEGTSKGYG